MIIETAAVLNVRKMQYETNIHIGTSGGSYTAMDVFIRFHGPRQLYSSCYPEQMIRDYAEKLVEWKNKGHNIWAFFNNDVNGQALKNAAMLQSCVNELS